MKRIDINMAITLQLDMRIGKLTIIAKDTNKDKWNRTKYICKCDCGKFKSISANYLNNKKRPILSCGCIKRNEDPQQISYINRYNQDKANAKNRNLDFFLTKEEHKQLILTNCYYCGKQPNNKFSPYTNQNGSLKAQALNQNIDLDHINNTFIIINGIDRYNNNIGYILSNCVTACWSCNKAKNDMHGDDFIVLVETINAHLTKR